MESMYAELSRGMPTVFDAIFNKLQFWDGRAKETFNGVNIQGAADTTAFVYRAPNPHLTQVKIGLNNSSCFPRYWAAVKHI
jgi:hypothetical protein